MRDRHRLRRLATARNRDPPANVAARQTKTAAKAFALAAVEIMRR